MPSDGRDPSGYITSPPSVIVKVIETARDDINGLLGIAISYNIERERYLVHMTLTQSTMALKKENLVKAGMMESYRAQFQQLQNDPRVKEKMTQYFALCQQHVAPWDLGSVIFGVLFVWFALIYLVGFIKTLMVTSLVILLLVIAGPDLTARSPPHIVLQNFPTRSREVIEKQMPILRGKLTNRMAVGVVLFLIAFCLQSLFFTKPTPARYPPPQQIKVPVTPPIVMEAHNVQKYYDLGFKDATNGNEHGAAIQEILESLKKDAQAEDLSIDPLLMLDDPLAAGVDIDDPNKQTLLSKITNLTNVASIFYLYRTIVDLGTEPLTGLFSIGQLAANMQHSTEWWRKALLVLSFYNVLRIFI